MGQPRGDLPLCLLNAATAMVVEELLRLPGPALLERTCAMLWGEAVSPGTALLDAVGHGRRPRLSALAPWPEPLALPLPGRLPAGADWRDPERLLREARGAARERYRALVVTLSRPAGRLDRSPLDPHWAPADAAGRLLDRVAGLNRAALAMWLTGRWPAPPGLAAAARHEALADQLPALAVPRFERLAHQVEPAGPEAIREIPPAPALAGAGAPGS
jgi:hypothetical protein